MFKKVQQCYLALLWHYYEYNNNNFWAIQVTKWCKNVGKRVNNEYFFKSISKYSLHINAKWDLIDVVPQMHITGS